MSQSLIGTTIGNYRVVDVLGEGGMGTVFRAVHPELDRTVAIKVLALGLSGSDDIVRRFRVEARAVNKIRHPNVVDVQDFGTLPDGRPYYVMEHLVGENLGDYLGRVGRLSPRDCLVIMLPVTEALEAAHNAGVVHRDLKPDNIFLLARTGAPPTPKLLDFGIAKVLSETIAGGGARTQSGALMGTPLYMSPEQAGGRVEDLSTPSDVYSLGVILYQMLSGAPPFDAPGFGELLMMHMQTPPPPIGGRVANLPPALEQLVMRMLSKAAADRPRDASAVRRELVAIAASLEVDGNRPLAHDPNAPTIVPQVQANTPSPSLLRGEVARRTIAPSRRSFVLAAAGTLVIAAIAVGVVLKRSHGDDSPTSAASAAPPASVVHDAGAAVPAAADAALPVDASPPVDASVAADAPAMPETDLEKRLRLLKELHDKKQLSDKDYDAYRKKILEHM